MSETHLTEEQIRVFLLSPEELTSGEKEELGAHISSCALCGEHLESARAFYGELSKKLEESPSNKDSEFTRKLLNKHARLRLPMSALERRDAGALTGSYVELANLSTPSAIERIMNFTRTHPIRMAGISVTAAGILVAGMLLLNPPADKNPAYVEVKGTTLTAFDKKGVRLWDRSARGLPQGGSLGSIANGGHDMNLLVLDDFDGDGKNEIILSGGSDLALSNSDFSPDSIYCLGYDGSIRWITGTGSRGSFPAVGADGGARWRVQGLFACRPAAKANPMIFALANYAPFWPNKLFEIDAATGQEKQAYWHPGGFDPVLIFDIDGDGSNEIILGGVNNAFGSACISVLRPTRIDGVGPTTPEFSFESKRPGTEEFYLLLPPTDVHFAYDRAFYNVLRHFAVVGGNQFVAFCQESYDTTGSYLLLYTFANGMVPKSIIGADSFLKLRKEQIEKGKIKNRPDADYYDDLKKSIRYWDGEKFVNQPTANRYSQEIARQ